jgi:hypothetical protein
MKAVVAFFLVLLSLFHYGPQEDCAQDCTCPSHAACAQTTTGCVQVSFWQTPARTQVSGPTQQPGVAVAFYSIFFPAPTFAGKKVFLSRGSHPDDFIDSQPPLYLRKRTLLI